MSFSWSCTDEAGNNLFHEFDINSQAIGLGDGRLLHSRESIRSTFYGIPYKEKFQCAAQDALKLAQGLVTMNLDEYNAPAHPECPSCKCERPVAELFPDFDVEQARRFISIPLTRVWRAGSSW